jgi:hypothetical protein
MMFYRMTRIHFESDRFGDLAAWAEVVRDRVEAIDGFLFADLVRTGERHGMVIAAYNSEAAYEGAAEVIAEIFGEMAGYLTDSPHTHAGTVELSLGR